MLKRQAAPPEGAQSPSLQMLVLSFLHNLSKSTSLSPTKNSQLNLKKVSTFPRFTEMTFLTIALEAGLVSYTLCDGTSQSKTLTDKIRFVSGRGP